MKPQGSDCGFERRERNEQTTFDDERSDQNRRHVEQWMQLRRDREGRWQKQVYHLTGGAEPLHREETRGLFNDCELRSDCPRSIGCCGAASSGATGISCPPSESSQARMQYRSMCEAKARRRTTSSFG